MSRGTVRCCDEQLGERVLEVGIHGITPFVALVEWLATVRTAEECMNSNTADGVKTDPELKGRGGVVPPAAKTAV